MPRPRTAKRSRRVHETKRTVEGRTSENSGLRRPSSPEPAFEQERPFALHASPRPTAHADVTAGTNSSQLLDWCESVRLRLVKLAARQTPSGTPVFGPALVFLEDPVEGVLRPASRVTWDQLKLGPILGDLLGRVFIRLSALAYAVSRNGDPRPVLLFLAAYERAIVVPQRTKSTPAEVSAELATLCRKLADLLLPSSKIATPVAAAVDDVLGGALGELTHLDDLLTQVEPFLVALASLSAADAASLGAPTEADHLAVDQMVRTIRVLLEIRELRLAAWNTLRTVLLDQGVDHSQYAKVIEGRGDSLLGLEKHTEYETLRQRLIASNPANPFSDAIELFRLGPQEVASSIGYLALQYRTAREHLRGTEPEDFDVRDLVFTPEARKSAGTPESSTQSRHDYDAQIVDAAPLYRITHRVERLFYGGATPAHGAALPHGHLSSIANITFIPIRYFSGQVIGQIVFIPPTRTNVRTLVEACREPLRQIPAAAHAEFITLVHRRLKMAFEVPTSPSVDRADVVRAVAEGLVRLLSVQNCLAFRMSGNRLVPLYLAHRALDPPPQTLLLNYLGLTGEQNIKGGLEDYLESALKKDIQVTSRQLKEEKLDAEHAREACEHLRKTVADAVPFNFLVAPGDSDLARTVAGVLEACSVSSRLVGRHLLLKVPLRTDGVANEDALFVVTLWEPHEAVTAMAPAIWSSAAKAIESCNVFVLDLARRLQIERSKYEGVAHDVNYGLDFLKYAAAQEGVALRSTTEQFEIDLTANRHRSFAGTAIVLETLFFERMGLRIALAEKWVRTDVPPVNETHIDRSRVHELSTFLFSNRPEYSPADLVRHLLGTTESGRWSNADSLRTGNWVPAEEFGQLLSGLGQSRTNVHWIAPAVFIEELARNAHDRRGRSVRSFGFFATTGERLRELIGEAHDSSSPATDFTGCSWALIYLDDAENHIPPDLFGRSGQVHRQFGTMRLGALDQAIAEQWNIKGFGNTTALRQIKIRPEMELNRVLAGKRHPATGLPLDRVFKKLVVMHLPLIED